MMVHRSADTVSQSAAAVAATKLWFERVVIGLSLCPWARPVHERRAVRFTHARHGPGDADGLVSTIWHEISLLASLGSHETTVVVAPRAWPDDFVAFYEFVQDAEDLLRANQLHEQYQLVAFHPRFVFGGEESEDASNFVNRSPHPSVHILRQADVTAAIDSYPRDTLDVPTINQRQCRRLGSKHLRGLVDQAQRDAEEEVVATQMRSVESGGARARDARMVATPSPRPRASANALVTLESV